ncbi:MAG: P1 family peptidase [Arenimonas sp.]|nr:P1 family peptidase [Arenimonas sp.]
MKHLFVCLLLCQPIHAAERARELGIPFDGTPGAYNAITDVRGVTVGHSTLHTKAADGKAIHTGVTAILPRGKDSLNTPVFGAWFAQNGNGEMTGTAWIDESGNVEGPIMLTNTHSVGVVRDAVIAYRVAQGDADGSGYWWSLPIVAETWDGHLNDINGFHVKPDNAVQAIEQAHAGAVEEGNVGGGSGMICHEFKCGMGSASRVVSIEKQAYVVGALVQANYGMRDSLRISGVPMGQYLRNDRVYSEDMPKPADTGSIIVVIATDAPLLPHQLKRIAKRVTMGLARMGSYAGNGSGDIFIAFSTANTNAQQAGQIRTAQFINNDDIDPLFEATVQATEEAIVNAMVAATDVMDGMDGHYAKAIDHRALIALLKKYNRYQPIKKSP